MPGTSNSEQRALPDELSAYQVRRKLADGGMSSVFLARHQPTSEILALKLTRDGTTPDQRQLVARAKLEAEALARCSHPHIVRVRDHGPTSDDGYFIALDYVEGPTLSRLAQSGALSVERSLTIAIQLAEALAHVHTKGIAHCDVKASNIMVSRDARGKDQIVLLDFGLAQFTDRPALPSAGLVMGSIHTMAPEQIRDRTPDHRADVYAYGVLLYRMLSGRYPYQARHRTEVLAAHLHGDVPLFASFAPNLALPDGLEAVVRRCLKKDANERYQTMADVLEDLHAYHQVSAEDFVTVTFALDTLPRIRRAISQGDRITQAVAGGAAVVALLALALAGWALWSS